MLRNWTKRLSAWLLSAKNNPYQRRLRDRRRSELHRLGAQISQLETLESRRLLTNLVAVHVNGGAVDLADISSGRPSTGDNFTVSYTSTQMVLTGTNGTSFKVGNQTLSTFTANVSGTLSLSMRLNSHGNTVTVTGDGTANLASLDVNLGLGLQTNTLTLTKVHANAVRINGGIHDDNVTLNQCSISGDLNVNLGSSSGDKLDLETTTVGGDVSDRVSQLVINHSTITGKLNDVELGKNSTYNSTASTYTGEVTVRMGRDGVINYLASTDGPNHTHSKVTFIGTRRHNAQIHQGAASAATGNQPTIVNDIPAHLIRTDEAVVPASNLTAPTVVSLPATKNTATITGTMDAKNSSVLSVAVTGGKTYKLGTDPELTSPAAGQWSLDLTDAPLTASTTTITATSSDKFGNTKTATGTATLDTQLDTELGTIHTFETTNNLTGKETPSGLNYVITTPGTGALPKAGQTVSVSYSGFLLNSNGTKGTEFDSNVDASFGHVRPFTFAIGDGTVIKGWDEAFRLLPAGTVATLIIPSKLAYGPQGNSQGSVPIPANAPLIFQVTLNSIT